MRVRANPYPNANPNPSPDPNPNPGPGPEQVALLGDLIKLVQGELDGLQRRKVMNLITMETHSRDINLGMISAGFDSKECFTWVGQLKTRLEKRGEDAAEDVWIDICDAAFRYSFEYLTNASNPSPNPHPHPHPHPNPTPHPHPHPHPNPNQVPGQRLAPRHHAAHRPHLHHRHAGSPYPHPHPNPSPSPSPNPN